MDLNHAFVVDAPIDETWRLLTDLEKIAPCLPGAELQEVDGADYKGIVKVKVGPMTAQYKGTARFVEKDDDAHRAVLDASGRETRGQGNASAVITAQLESHESGTSVELRTELTITGKVAQFGRGVLADVSEKLLGQFVQNLERDVLSAAPVATPASTNGNEANATDLVGGQPESGTTGSAGARKIDSPAAEPIDLLDVSGAPLAKRLAPLVGVIVVVLVIRWLRSRGR